MKVIFLIGFIVFSSVSILYAQQRCGTFIHAQQLLHDNPYLQKRQEKINSFIAASLRKSGTTTANARPALTIIKIPVIVHVIYHREEENVSEEAISNQLFALNRDYQRKNADSVGTPATFKSAAADCKIEFDLAKVDPAGRSTSGIERIYSPVTKWDIEGDKVKFAASHGIDAWDANSYLNIWVCNLEDLLGYSSVLGDDIKKDGIVINYTVFNNLEDGGAFNSGRTAVHEIGHWLGLKHLWGDAECGDDGVADTPAQSTFTTGCPSGIRLSCGNTTNGDMYMNFMDYTNDPCMNLFTVGQSDRIRTLFDQGGIRTALLSSKALGVPWVADIPLPDDMPRWLFPKLYPNPAAQKVTIDLKYDAGWVGQEILITNVSGQVIIRHQIISSVETIDISKLLRGIYFIRSGRDGMKLGEKFVKM